MRWAAALCIRKGDKSPVGVVGRLVAKIQLLRADLARCLGEKNAAVKRVCIALFMNCVVAHVVLERFCDERAAAREQNKQGANDGAQGKSPRSLLPPSKIFCDSH